MDNKNSSDKTEGSGIYTPKSGVPEGGYTEGHLIQTKKEWAIQQVNSGVMSKAQMEAFILKLSSGAELE